MKLKKKQEEKPKVSASVRGRRNRNKGADFERRVAKQLQEATDLEFVRTPQSGGFAKNKQTAEGFRGDIVPADSNADFVLHIECKNTQTIQIKKWWGRFNTVNGKYCCNHQNATRDQTAF